MLHIHLLNVVVFMLNVVIIIAFKMLIVSSPTICKISRAYSSRVCIMSQLVFV